MTSSYSIFADDLGGSVQNKCQDAGLFIRNGLMLFQGGL